MHKIGDFNTRQLARTDNYEARTEFADRLLPILESLQENLPFFRQKANTTALMMTAREWATPLLKSGYTIDDCQSAYGLIILLGLKDLQLADLIRIITIQRRYRREDINEARKIVLEGFSDNPIADLCEIIKPIANRNAIERENRVRLEHEKSLSIGMSQDTRRKIKKEKSEKAKYTLEKLKEMFGTTKKNVINFN